jgi:hypothetical protein
MVATEGRVDPNQWKGTPSHDHPAVRPPSAEPLDHLADHVHSQLGSRILDFRVQRSGGGLILTGLAHTYYAKQLAQHCVMAMTDLPILANDIDVR